MTPLAAQFIAQLEVWAQPIADIRLILVLGSQARADDPADELSDVDVVLVCRDHRRYLDDAGWLTQIGTPILTFREPTATGGEFERRVLFSSGLDVDISVIAEATAQSWAADGLPADVLPVMRRGMHVVVDKDGLAPRLLESIGAASSSPARPSPEDLIEKVHDFLYHCLLAARKAARGELFVALQSIDCYLRRQLFELIQIHANFVRGQPTAWYGARMIERRADTATIAGLAATCAGHDITSIRRALSVAMNLHSSLAGDVFERLGLVYPVHVEAHVQAMIADIELNSTAAGLRSPPLSDWPSLLNRTVSGSKPAD
jgi:hypothetical protein